MYEVVLGRPVDKSGFRTRTLAADFLDEVGSVEGESNRSAAAYRIRDRQRVVNFPLALARTCAWPPPCAAAPSRPVKRVASQPGPRGTMSTRRLNAVVDVLADEALAAADAADAARCGAARPWAAARRAGDGQGQRRQAGRATTNGVVAFKDLIATEDSPVVANLRRAGAVIIGRTNTPAFSVRWFTDNALHGARSTPGRRPTRRRVQRRRLVGGGRRHGADRPWQ
jgi:hypothetical protein